ncbi:MAG: YggU family protein, partial [Aeromonas sp.]
FKVAKGQVTVIRGELGRHKTLSVLAPKQLPDEITALLADMHG